MKTSVSQKFIAALLSSTSFAVPAFAQDEAEPTVASDTAEEAVQGNAIIVTARRQDEQLQDVPASISVISADTLALTGAERASDFVQLTPGVTIVAGGVESADTQINIRGLNGSRDAESNVALVVDGILKSNTSSLNQDQGAVSQIEVLKGPQGAIYGRNATAGAIVITTKRPDDFLEVSGKVSAANNDTYSAAGGISGPIGDGIGFVINGDYGRSDGFYRNPFLADPLNTSTYPGNPTDPASMDNYERWNVNGRLLWELGASSELDLKARYGESKSGAILFNAAFQIPLLADIIAPAFNIDVNEHQFLFTPNVDPLNKQTTFESSLRLTTALSDTTELVGYVSYNKIDNFFYADGTSGTFGFFAEEPNCVASLAALDGYPVQTPFGIGGGAFLPPYSPVTCDGTQFQQRNQEDYSAEVRLIGEFGRMNWQVGAYYLNIKRDVCLNLGIDTGEGVIPECFTTDPRNRTESLADDTFKTDVYAAFASVDYELTDTLDLGLALRYDIEDRKVSNNVPLDARTLYVGNVLTGNPNGTPTTPADYFLNPGLDPVYNPSGVFEDRSETFKQLQPKVTLSYKPSANLNLFANWGIGFKSGGFNSSGSKAIVDGFFNDVFGAGLSIFDTYDKEKSSSYEVGLKWNDGTGAASFELAGYYTEVTDMQFFEFFVGPFGLLRVVSNIDEVELKGVEAAANVRLVEGWSVFATGNVIDSEIKENDARPYTVGNKSPYTADYTLNLGTQIEAPISETFDVVVRGDFRLTGPTWFHTVQENEVPNIFGLQGNFTNSQRDAYSTLDIRFGLRSDRWSIMAFGNNITGTDYLAEVIPAPEFGGDFISPGPQELYGVEVTFNF
ncbi:TonB-dependent receptor [Altererythrobacter sp. GH1-8]|uniref:TonB-dependent receptor n=1 Tax=Altererythrobacter sp. GH1-8 TaxID=3349333 RepID=UPI00374D084E